MPRSARRFAARRVRNGTRLRRFIESLALAAAVAAAPSPLRASDAAVRLIRAPHGEYRLVGQFSAAASPKTAWAVLTDYDRIEEFVPSMKESRVVKRSGLRAVVDQSSEGKLLFFGLKVSLMLDIVELPLRGIMFRDTLLHDFYVYEGEWRVEPSRAGVVVTYELHAKPRFAVPAFVMRGQLKKTVRAMLNDVQAEMLRRESGRSG